MINISIIIPTHNGGIKLKNVLESLLRLDYPRKEYEIIVVDNASKDNTKHIVEHFLKNYSNIKCIYESNIGLHNARHAGAKIAKGEILLYIDDDVVAEKNLIKEILKPYLEPNVGCVGGKVLPKWEVVPPQWINLFPKCYLSILDDNNGPKEVRWIYGCNFSIRRQLLFDVGGFNPDGFSDKKLWYYRGDGEIGLLKKVHNIYKKVIYNPKAIVWHCISKNRIKINYFKERAFKSGAETSFSKYHYASHKKYNYFSSIIYFIIFGLYYISFNSIFSIIFYKKINYYKYKVLAFYYKARCLYEINMIFNSNLKMFVKKKKWLN